MTYTIALPEQGSKSYQRLDAAKEFASTKAIELGAELEVIDTETSTVAFMATPVVGRIFHPWERVETPTFSAPHFEGFYPAYTRKRISATVYRSYDDEAELPWLVHDGRTGGTQLVPNTKAACKLTSEMRHGRTL